MDKLPAHAENTTRPTQSRQSSRPLQTPDSPGASALLAPTDPLPLPANVVDLLKGRRNSAIDDLLSQAAKKRVDTDSAFEPSGPFAPTADAAGSTFPQDINDGLSPDPKSRLPLNPGWGSTQWKGSGEVVWRNLRIPRSEIVWDSVIPLFETQYADYLEHTQITIKSEKESVQTVSALLINPSTVSCRVAVLEASSLQLSDQELAFARTIPVRLVESNLEASIALLDRARDLQRERENKAALAASFALEFTSFLAEDRRQRIAIASGLTVRDLVDAVGAWEAARIEADALALQARSLFSLAAEIEREDAAPVLASTRLAYAGSWINGLAYGPSVETLSNGQVARGTEIKDAAHQVARSNAKQLADLYRTQVSEITARGTAAQKRAAAEKERAAAGAHAANEALERIGDAVSLAKSKVVLACYPGGALNYADQERRTRKEYLAILREAVLRVGVTSKGLATVFGASFPLPREVARLLPQDLSNEPGGVLGAAEGDQPTLTADILMAALTWVRDVANWIVIGSKGEYKRVLVFSLRKLVSPEVWEESQATGRYSFVLESNAIRSSGAVRLRALAFELMPRAHQEDAAAAYCRATFTLPSEGLYFHATGPQRVPQTELLGLELGRVRVWNSSRIEPAPELADILANSSPFGPWEVQMEPGLIVEDCLLHLWVANRHGH